MRVEVWVCCHQAVSKSPARKTGDESGTDVCVRVASEVYYVYQFRFILMEIKQPGKKYLLVNKVGPNCEEN